ncbi:hypothetical protein J6590_079961 [Homalodisca vitripennis]|nr:hypothetical protein J6590_079961 [Homalodisca vitripennis]
MITESCVFTTQCKLLPISRPSQIRHPTVIDDSHQREAAPSGKTGTSGESTGLRDNSDSWSYDGWPGQVFRPEVNHNDIDYLNLNCALTPDGAASL